MKRSITPAGHSTYAFSTYPAMCTYSYDVYYMVAMRSMITITAVDELSADGESAWVIDRSAS